jgi:competence protein ComEA
MTSLRPRADHQEAVARRLASLTAELAATRPDEPAGAVADEPWLADHTRIRPLRAVPDPVPHPGPPPPVPEVGRHAARRASAPGLLPEAVRGRVALGPTQLAVVAVLVAIGLAVTGWWLVRGQPDRIEAPPTPAGAAPSETAAPLTDAAPAGAATTASPATSITVDVTGRVRRPGIVVLDAGARVVDAVEAAGGAPPQVDLSSINLARVLVDGEQIIVGPAATGAAGAAAGAAVAPVPGSPSGPLVNLNTATQPELESLPEVGPVTAQSILAWRTEHGGFTSVDELLEVDGIGDATLAQITPYVTI